MQRDTLTGAIKYRYSIQQCFYNKNFIRFSKEISDHLSPLSNGKKYISRGKLRSCFQTNPMFEKLSSEIDQSILKSWYSIAFGIVWDISDLFRLRWKEVSISVPKREWKKNRHDQSGGSNGPVQSIYFCLRFTIAWNFFFPDLESYWDEIIVSNRFKTSLDHHFDFLHHKLHHGTLIHLMEKS